MDRKLKRIAATTGLEVKKEVDLFFCEGANGPISIVDALSYVRRKAKGGTEAELRDILSQMRRAAHAEPDSAEAID